MVCTRWLVTDCKDVVKGSGRPLVRTLNISCPEIHGETGLDCKGKFPEITKGKGAIATRLLLVTVNENYLVYMYKQIMAAPARVSLICTAALTNIALLLRVFPDVVNNLRDIVILGGAMGIGNMGPVMEWNIMVRTKSTIMTCEVDPEAAKMVFECGLKVVQIPIDVTHTV